MDKKSIVCTSSILGADMHVITYGKKGLPVVVFPTQGQEPESLEEVGVIDELADYLDSGVIQLFCAETVDNESWGGTGDPAARAQRQETYYHYVVDELVPLVHKVSKSDARPLALGCDAGATQAAIVALRRPDLFQGCVCLSGCYDALRYFGDWMDATLYENTPCAFLPNMGPEHPYVAVYNQRQLLFCTGQEASEADSLRSTRVMDEQLARLGVEAWCDYWGADVTHTWFWWKKQLRYFLPIVLADVEKTTAAEKPVKKRAPRKKAATTAAKPAAAKTAAKKTAATAATKAEPAEKTVKPAAKTTATAAKTAAKKAAPAAKEAPAKKTAAAEKPAAAAKATTTKAPAAKKAAPAKAAAAVPAAEKKPAEKTVKPAAATKPATPAKAEKPATPAKAPKAAAPAKAVKAAAPAKAAKPATPAKATKPATPAKAERPAAPAKAATKPAAKGKATK